MNQTELRRKRLLEETSKLYSDQRPPAVHPRYQNAYSELYETGNQSSGTFGFRLLICLILLICFAVMDYKEKTILNVNSIQVKNVVSDDAFTEEILKIKAYIETR